MKRLSVCPSSVAKIQQICGLQTVHRETDSLRALRVNVCGRAHAIPVHLSVCLPKAIKI